MRNSDRNKHSQFCSLHKAINNSQEACRFVCVLSRGTQTNSRGTVHAKCFLEVFCTFHSKTADLNIFSFVGVNEGQAKTFLRQITGQQLWPAQINS